MYDLSQPNDEPGECCKCRGTGIYRWGMNGSKEGLCFSCGGAGKQTRSDIGRNCAYNRHKIARIARL
jgi:hypothetical protein